MPKGSSILTMGPTTRKEKCVGYGTPYCFSCTALSWCPAETNTTITCNTCRVKCCPCRGEDLGYESRKTAIQLWLKSREASVAFESAHWHPEYEFES